MADLQEELITLLQQFGLSRNACKAYVSLLKNNPATGYAQSACAVSRACRGHSIPQAGLRRGCRPR